MSAPEPVSEARRVAIWLAMSMSTLAIAAAQLDIAYYPTRVEIDLKDPDLAADALKVIETNTQDIGPTSPLKYEVNGSVLSVQGGKRTS